MGVVYAPFFVGVNLCVYLRVVVLLVNVLCGVVQRLLARNEWVALELL